MPRPRLNRICQNHDMKFFKPSGIRMSELEVVELLPEELEALKLKDLDLKDQNEAAEQMGVSQPTFHRIINEARKKISDALINNKGLKMKSD